MRSFAGEYGLEVAGVDKGRRAVTLRGTVQAVADAFGAQGLQLFEHPTAGQYRGRQGPLTVPSRARGRDHRRVRDRRPAAGAGASAPERPRPPPRRTRRPRSPPRTTSRRGQRLRSDGGDPRAGRRVQPDRPRHLLQGPRADGAERHRGQRRRRHELAGHRPERRRRGDARHRGARRGRARVPRSSSTSRPTPTRASSTRSRPRCTTPRNKPSVVSISWGGPEDSWTAAGADADGADPHRGGRARRDRDRGLGRQRLDRRGDRRQAARRLPRLRAPRARLRRDDAEHRERPDRERDRLERAAQRRRRRRGHQHRVRRCPPISPATKMPDNVDTGKPGRGVPDVAGDADPETGYSILVDGEQQTSAARARWRRCGPG